MAKQMESYALDPLVVYNRMHISLSYTHTHTQRNELNRIDASRLVLCLRLFSYSVQLPPY